MAELVLISLILFPLVAAYLLKSNTSLVFLSICAGVVLINFTSSDAVRLLKELNYSTPDGDLLSLAFISVPLVLTLFLTARSAPHKAKFLLHAIPALGAGALLTLTVVPLLSGSFQADFGNSPIWTNLHKIQAWVVGAGALASLLMLWFGGFKRYRSHHK